MKKTAFICFLLVLCILISSCQLQPTSNMSYTTPTIDYDDIKESLLCSLKEDGGFRFTNEEFDGFDIITTSFMQDIYAQYKIPCENKESLQREFDHFCTSLAQKKDFNSIYQIYHFVKCVDTSQITDENRISIRSCLQQYINEDSSYSFRDLRYEKKTSDQNIVYDIFPTEMAYQILYAIDGEMPDISSYLENIHGYLSSDSFITLDNMYVYTLYLSLMNLSIGISIQDCIQSSGLAYDDLVNRFFTLLTENVDDLSPLLLISYIESFLQLTLMTGNDVDLHKEELRVILENVYENAPDVLYDINTFSYFIYSLSVLQQDISIYNQYFIHYESFKLYNGLYILPGTSQSDPINTYAAYKIIKHYDFDIPKDTILYYESVKNNLTTMSPRSLFFIIDMMMEESKMDHMQNQALPIKDYLITIIKNELEKESSEKYLTIMFCIEALYSMGYIDRELVNNIFLNMEQDQNDFEDMDKTINCLLASSKSIILSRLFVYTDLPKQKVAIQSLIDAESKRIISLLPAVFDSNGSGKLIILYYALRASNLSKTSIPLGQKEEILIFLEKSLDPSGLYRYGDSQEDVPGFLSTYFAFSIKEMMNMID